MAALDRASIAEECVRQGVYFGVEPHYLLAVAQVRSGISSDDDANGKGLFRLTQAQWDANRTSDEFELDFASAQIISPIRQCAVFGLMAHNAFEDFVKTNNRNPTTKELYLKQFPGADATGLQAALDNTAPLIGPAANAVLDDPQSVSPVANADQPTEGPPVITPDPIPPVPGGGGAAGGGGMLTLAMLQRNWRVPPAKAEVLQGMVDTADVLSRLGINTPLRMAHFMAQISEETGNGKSMIESLSYSAETMMRVFPKRFPTVASTNGFVHNERPFGNKVYNGRMGNRMGSDDGFNFRGRGCLQITGHNNYDVIGRSLGLDLVNNPDFAIAPQNLLAIAATVFIKHGCLPDCDRNNVVQVSARINLGHPMTTPQKINGLDERKRQLVIWKREFGL
jgi:putative chitinase